MNSSIRNSAIALALVMIPASALAQTTITTTTETRGPVALTPEQRTVIYRTVTRERRVTPPAAVVPAPAPGPVVSYEVGAPVPREVAVYDFPEDAYIEVPQLRSYRYVYVNNRLMLVDPATSRVIDVIAE
jgi:hypothetical protein